MPDFEASFKRHDSFKKVTKLEHVKDLTETGQRANMRHEGDEAWQ